jgi:hypothetical protein
MGTMSTFDRYAITAHVVAARRHDTVTSQMDVTHLATFSDADEGFGLRRRVQRTDRSFRARAENWMLYAIRWGTRYDVGGARSKNRVRVALVAVCIRHNAVDGHSGGMD